MNIKDILLDNRSDNSLLFEEAFYSSIYKKTEKITCAVFLITDFKKDDKNTSDLVSDIRKIAKDTLLAVATLSMAPSSSVVLDIKRPLELFMMIRSLLRVLVVSKTLRGDVVDVLTREIDGVMRAIHGLSLPVVDASSVEQEQESPSFILTPKKGFPRKKVGRPRGQGQPQDQAEDMRRESILSIIRTQGVVSIKDISDAITDCSEKTIQRELMGMIKDNIIVKEGERRWSRYRIA